ncbi:hypothetical protein KIPB_011411 [Kipferlia bialata]|uniref:F5/8 type C domain-containing protein n=1 Tax=Kipferlia bialata TaxID=797122 RepID=A0A9K3D859_9EUKA|nr:hypothetical protein KIPB_011411 [Kipferlia bialata]|eukprot:g11411.t1
MSVFPGAVSGENSWEPVYEVPPPEAPDMHYEDERDELKSELAASHKGIQAARRMAVWSLVVAVVVSLGSVVAALLISLAVRRTTDEYVLLTRLNTLSDELDAQADTVSGLDADVDGMADSVASLTGVTDTLSTDMSTLSDTVTGHTSSLSTLGSDMTSLLGDVTALDTASDTLSSAVSTLSTSVSTNEASLSALSTDVVAAQSDIGTLAVYADPNVSYTDAYPVLMDGVTVNSGVYFRSVHSTADDALTAVRSLYTGVTVWETVEKEIADVRFSSVAERVEEADHGHGFTLRDKGLTTRTGVWAANTCDIGQYALLVFDTPTAVCAVATAGRPGLAQFVTSFAIEYYDPDQDVWVSVDEAKDSFDANTDVTSVVLHTLATPVVADRFRIRVLAWEDHISMRLEVYGWQ